MGEYMAEVLNFCCRSGGEEVDGSSGEGGDYVGLDFPEMVGVGMNECIY